MKLSDHFDSSEFACHCCGQVIEISPDLVEQLEELSEVFSIAGKRATIVILSGYRCPAHNKAVGGAPHSQHMQGIASDIKVKSSVGEWIAPSRIADYLEKKYPDSHGIGRYKTWVHLILGRTRRGGQVNYLIFQLCHG
jgi:uncharacterized protein YcbK (DUF882 family)